MTAAFTAPRINISTTAAATTTTTTTTTTRPTVIDESKQAFI